eukprot:1915473-Rhodomonas_salina.1
MKRVLRVCCNAAFLAGLDCAVGAEGSTTQLEYPCVFLLATPTSPQLFCCCRQDDVSVSIFTLAVFSDCYGMCTETTREATRPSAAPRSIPTVTPGTSTAPTWGRARYATVSLALAVTHRQRADCADAVVFGLAGLHRRSD